MAPTNRAAVIKKTHNVLKKHFKPVAPVSDRLVLEHLLYACCLENSRPSKADECFAKLQELYFDWNEVRVTTVRELSELFNGLGDPTAAAICLKRTLQSVFESIYSFDLEFLKKQNLGQAVKKVESFKGPTSFTVSYVTEHGLGGHSIPLGKSGVSVMHIVGAVSDAEANKGVVPGLERAIPKTKGLEFASLLQQMSAEFFAAPHSPKVRAILTEIAPDAKVRMPKRGAKTAESTKPVKKKPAKAKKAPKPEAVSPNKKKAAVPKQPVVKKTTKKSASKPLAKKAKPAKAKKSASKQLARRKPR